MSQYLSQPRGYASESETGSMYELRQYPSYYSSQASITPYGSHKSLLSMYTPSQVSTFLPIVQNAPNPEKRPADNFGIAMFSVFINPIFGVIAIFLSREYCIQRKTLLQTIYHVHIKRLNNITKIYFFYNSCHISLIHVMTLSEREKERESDCMHKLI